MTIPLRTDFLPRCDGLVIAPQARDAALSCLDRLRGEAARGRRTLVVSLFEADGDKTHPWLAGARRALDVLGIEVVALGLPNASKRSGSGKYRDLVSWPGPREAETRDLAAHHIRQAVSSTRAKDIYGPLGLPPHSDYRLAHEALVSALADEPGRNVLLYEERPEALSKRAVAIRLGLIGARLPPAARRLARTGGGIGYALGAPVAPRMRGDLTSHWDGLIVALAALGAWRASRRWNPARALGPRVHPVIHDWDSGTEILLREHLDGLLHSTARRRREGDRFLARAASYSRRLGSHGYAERYWLLLPDREVLTPVASRLALELGA